MAVWSVDFLVVIPVLKIKLLLDHDIYKGGLFQDCTRFAKSSNTMDFFMSLFLFLLLLTIRIVISCFFCSGPVLALGLAREDAITGWRHMLGPTEVEKAKSEAPERWIFIKLPIVSFNGNNCPYCSPQIRFTFCLEKLFLQKKLCVQIYLHLFSKLNTRISMWKIWGKKMILFHWISIAIL